MASRQPSETTRERTSTLRASWRPIVLLATSLCACGAPAPPSAPAKPAPAVAVVLTPPPVTSEDPLDIHSLPKVEIRGREILLDGKLVGDARGIVEMGRLTKLDELFVSLRARRAGATERGEPPQGEIAIVAADDEVAWVVVESVARTAAFAGYPVALLRSRPGWLRVRTPVPVPGPPDEDTGAPEPPRFEITIDIREGDVEASLLELTAVPPSASEGGGFARTLVKREVVPPPPEHASAAVVALVAHACAQAPRTCLDRVGVRVVPGARLADVVTILSSAVTGAPQEQPTDSQPEVVLVQALPREDGFTSPPGPPSRVRVGQPGISGRLPPEVIQRIVRASFGDLRKCYEDGLRRNPNLAGRIAVRFVIGWDGSVTEASEVGPQGGSPSSPASTPMPDRAVVSCVLHEFTKINFPRPEGGIVTVVYPIQFSPGS